MTSSYRHILTMAVVATTIIATTDAFGAAVTVGSKLKLTNSPNAGSNGEFEVFLKPDSGATQQAKDTYNAINTNNAKKGNQVFSGKEDFRTFCVEGGKDVEYFNPGRELTVAGLGIETSSFAYPYDTPTLTKKAAALYREFATNQTNGYTFNFFGDGNFSYGGTNRNTDANLLQNAIWYYLGSITIGTTIQDAINANKYIAAMEQYSSIADALQIGTDSLGQHIGGVRIMNLVDESETFGTKNYYAQDQLYYIEQGPGPLTAVPEPSSICVFGAALAAVVARRRRTVCKKQPIA